MADKLHTQLGSARSEAMSADTDEFRMFYCKILPCRKRYSHDWSECVFSHEGEKVQRRCPRRFKYMGFMCPDLKKTGQCPRGSTCCFAHNSFEYWLHPTRYRTELCTYGPACQRPICFFAHTSSQLRIPEDLLGSTNQMTQEPEVWPGRLDFSSAGMYGPQMSELGAAESVDSLAAMQDPYQGIRFTADDPVARLSDQFSGVGLSSVEAMAGMQDQYRPLGTQSRSPDEQQLLMLQQHQHQQPRLQDNIPAQRRMAMLEQQQQQLLQQQHMLEEQQQHLLQQEMRQQQQQQLFLKRQQQQQHQLSMLRADPQPQPQLQHLKFPPQPQPPAPLGQPTHRIMQLHTARQLQQPLPQQQLTGGPTATYQQAPGYPQHDSTAAYSFQPRSEFHHHSIHAEPDRMPINALPSTHMLPKQAAAYPLNQPSAMGPILHRPSYMLADSLQQQPMPAQFRMPYQ